MKRRIRIALLAIWGFFIIAVNTGPSYVSGTCYRIDESTDFTGNRCQNCDSNNVTSSLNNRLESGDWSGTFLSNSNAWPGDYIEQNYGGIVQLAGDDETLTVNASHGNRALIQFGYQKTDRRTVSLPATCYWSSISNDIPLFRAGEHYERV